MVSKIGRPVQLEECGGLFDLAMALNADMAQPLTKRNQAHTRRVSDDGDDGDDGDDSDDSGDKSASFCVDCDPLTRYLTRLGLIKAFERELLNQQHPCAFLLAGINRLAMVNEAYGIDVADELIVATAVQLKKALRKTDILGRYAGNKYGIILRDCDEERMRETARRLLATINDRGMEVGAGVIPIAISLGGVVIGQDGGGAREAMLQAEEALSHARTRYIGSFQVFRASELRETERRRNIKLSDDIVCALNDRRIAIAKQPIVSAATGEVDFHECLVRMVRTNGEVVPAGEFVPAAEKLGLTRYLDHRVLELVVESLLANPGESYSLNVSVPTALLSNDWFDTLNSAVGGRPDLACRLIVEITETVAITDVEASIRFVADLRALGCRIAIDDFGAGYTSFRNLKLLDVDMVKIDGAFVKNLSNSPDDQVFVRTLIDLAHNFNLQTVAEWVGSAADAELLRGWGVDYFQGFLFGEPTLDQSVQKTKAAKPLAVVNS